MSARVADIVQLRRQRTTHETFHDLKLEFRQVLHLTNFLGRPNTIIEPIQTHYAFLGALKHPNEQADSDRTSLNTSARTFQTRTTQDPKQPMEKENFDYLKTSFRGG